MNEMEVLQGGIDCLTLQMSAGATFAAAAYWMSKNDYQMAGICMTSFTAMIGYMSGVGC